MSRKRTPLVGVVNSGDETLRFLNELGLLEPRSKEEWVAHFIAPILGKRDATLALAGVPFPLVIAGKNAGLMAVAEWISPDRTRLLIRAVLDHDNLKRYWERMEPARRGYIAGVCGIVEVNPVMMLKLEPGEALVSPSGIGGLVEPWRAIPQAGGDAYYSPPQRQGDKSGGWFRFTVEAVQTILRGTT